ncbi:unnamed protein product [Colias eurytheme]|nr:unnamed protein product [Colias eurytheme]
MAKKEIYIFIAFAALAFATEAEDSEQKKRGAGKANALNAIPTGAQKPEYTYSIYPQNSGVQSNPSQTYQSQVPNSFYPNQAPSQYYSSGNSAESTSVNVQQQTNNVPQQTHFSQLNYVPNSAFQQKYQIVPSKPSNNVHLAVLQQPTPYPTSSLLHYPQMQILATNPASHISPHGSILSGITPHSHFNFPHYQLPAFGNPFLTHPSTMVFVPQINPNLYSNLAYTSPSQGVVNFYSGSTQAKQSYPSSLSISSSNEYEKQHGAVPQSSVSKEDNDLSLPSDYITSDANNAYKNAYSTGRNSYTKI